MEEIVVSFRRLVRGGRSMTAFQVLSPTGFIFECFAAPWDGALSLGCPNCVHHLEGRCLKAYGIP